MKDQRFNKAIQNIKNISMSSIEKKIVLERIFGANVKLPEKKASIKSPWTIYSFSNWISSNRLVSAIAIILIVALSGNGIVLAANESLPGDTLYSFKVNIAEPIRIALTSDPVLKAKVKTELVQKRFIETETLAMNDKLDVATQNKVLARIETQVTDLNNDIKEVEMISTEKADDVTATVEASVRTHTKVLAMINDRKGKVLNNSTIKEKTVVNKAVPQVQKTVKQVIPNEYQVVTSASTPVPTTFVGVSNIPTDSNNMINKSVEPILMNVEKSSTNEIKDNQKDFVTLKSSEDANTSLNNSIKNTRNASSTQIERAKKLEEKIQKKEAELFTKAQERIEKADKKTELKSRKSEN